MKARWTATIALLWLTACKDPLPDGGETLLRLRELKELATVEYSVTKIISAKDESTWYKLGDRRILMSCRATVKAGVDLSRLTEQDVSVSGEEITLRLPKAELLSFSIRPEDIRVEYQEVGMLRSGFTAEERNGLMAQGEAQIRANMASTGILGTAETNAALFISNILRQLGFAKVNVRFGDAPLPTPKPE